MRRRLLIAVPIAAAIAVAVLASLALVQGSSATGRRPAAASADPALGPAGNVDAVRRAIANGAVVVDVRTDAEWSAGSLPGAVHIPLAQVPERYQELPRGQRVVTVCKDGGLSGKAADALRQVGYDVVNLDGGLTAWVAAGLPVVDASGGSGEVL